ncbi:hypothetical protein CO115_03445, partial [Candidatus Falkowbacteria bacterium CG_4_9_14_3_um_filter_36_9]
IKNKKGLILGFVFGAFIAPFLAVFGLVISFFELLRPLLIGPMDFVGNLIPNIQTAPNTYYAPIYKWILTLGTNGVCYALVGGIIQSFIGGIIQSFIRSRKEQNKLPKN